MAALPDRLAAALADRYRLDEEIGRGGMAIVYRAEDLKHRRRVALKVLQPELAAAVGGERFQREIEIAARLRHPHILPLYDSGEAEGVLYYVMPYVEGESLRDRLTREKQLPLDDALRVAREVADGLSYAHSHGVVHRDIKPENILLESAHAVIADFGIARAISAAGGDRITATGLAVGTAPYMSPEQAAGATDLDGRSDLYSLGCVLYEMLAGEPPFTGPTAESVLHQHLTAAPRSIAERRPAVPAPVAAALSRALAKIPADRFSPVGQFAEALGRAATAGPAAPARPGGTGDKSVVVLPFANLSPDPDNAYFADGLTEEIIADLSKVRALTVISRTSAMKFKGTDADVRQIAESLGVRYVLEGSVRKAGGSIRITAQLIDAETGAHLWAEKYSGTLDDVFAMQEQLSRTIVSALEVRLTPADERRIGHRSSEDPRAYECYLRARQEIWSFSRDGLQRAVSMAREGIEQLGESVLLYRILIGAYGLLLGGVGVWQPDNERGLAEAADKALALDPESPEAHFGHGVLAYVHNDRAATVRALRRSVEIDPGYVDAMLFLVNAYIEVGYPEAAAPVLRRVLELDPLTPMTHQMIGYLDLVEGRPEAAVASNRKAYEMAHDHPMMTWAYAQALAAAGHTEEALMVVDGMSADALATPQGTVARVLACALRGDAEGARAAMTPEAAAAIRTQGYLSRDVAGYYAVAGCVEEAFTWLENAVERGIIAYPYLAFHLRFLEPIRGEARFRALMQRVKPAWEAFEA